MKIRVFSHLNEKSRILVVLLISVTNSGMPESLLFTSKGIKRLMVFNGLMHLVILTDQSMCMAIVANMKACKQTYITGLFDVYQIAHMNFSFLF